MRVASLRVCNSLCSTILGFTFGRASVKTHLMIAAYSAGLKDQYRERAKNESLFL